MSEPFEGEVMTSVDGKMMTLEPIDEVLLKLKGRYQLQQDRNKWLREENEKLKSGVWEKEEIVRLKEELARYKEYMKYGFGISKGEHDKIEKWMEKWKGTRLGAIGGGFEYRFQPTSIGTIVTVVGPGNEKLIVRDLDE